MPPASSISCGVQWPATKTGSSHSSAATVTSGSSIDGLLHRVDARALARDQVERGAASAPVACAIVRTSHHRLAERPRVERDDLRARPAAASAIACDLVVADGADRAQLLRDDQVGLELAQQLLVEAVDRVAALGALAHGGVDLAPSSGRAAARRA